MGILIGIISIIIALFFGLYDVKNKKWRFSLAKKKEVIEEKKRDYSICFPDDERRPGDMPPGEYIDWRRNNGLPPL